MRLPDMPVLVLDESGSMTNPHNYPLQTNRAFWVQIRAALLEQKKALQKQEEIIRQQQAAIIRQVRGLSAQIAEIEKLCGSDVKMGDMARPESEA